MKIMFSCINFPISLYPPQIMKKLFYAGKLYGLTGMHYTPVHGDASSYKVCLQKVKQFRGSCLDKHSMKFWTFHVTLTLNTSKQPFHKRIQFMTMYHQTKSDCKKIN